MQAVGVAAAHLDVIQSPPAVPDVSVQPTEPVFEALPDLLVRVVQVGRGLEPGAAVAAALPAEPVLFVPDDRPPPPRDRPTGVLHLVPTRPHYRAYDTSDAVGNHGPMIEQYQTAGPDSCGVFP